MPNINSKILGNVIAHNVESTSSGISINAYELISNGRLFQVNYESVPDYVFGNYTVANMEFVSMLNSTSETQSCSYGQGFLTNIYSYIYNLIVGRIYRPGYLISCGALRVAEINATG